jgi:HSP20 family protein
MNRLFEDATHCRARTDANGQDEFERADWTPAADVYETEAGYSIAIDLPGVNRDELEIDLEENRLIVKGSRVIDEPTKYRTERSRGRFFRAFSVPGLVDQAQISAEYKDGVLQVRLPKRKEQKAQRVEIKIS